MKISKREKTFFALTDFYGGGGQALIGVLYLVFLMEVLGIRPVLASLIVTICEVWDAFSDPLMGIIGDNFRSKFGRRKPFIVVGGILLIIAFSLLFMPITGLDDMTLFFVALMINIFYNTVSTMILVSYNSLSAEISTDSNERDKANILRLIVSTVATALCTLVPTLVWDMYTNGSIDVNTFYIIVGIVFGVLFGVPVILCGIFCKERIDVPTEKVKPKVTDFIEPLKIRPFRQLLLMYLGQAICMDIFSAGIALFAKYVTTPKGSSTIFLGIFIVVQLLAFPIVNKLVKNTNTNKIYGYLLPIAILAMIIFACFGQQLYVGYGCIFVVAVGFAGAQLTSWIMYPHTVDVGELVLKKRNSGSYSAIMTFARKLSTSIAVGIFGVVLEYTGYNKDLVVQVDSAKLGIKLVMSITCIVFMFVGYIVAGKYILSKKIESKVDKYLGLQREGKLDENDQEYKELMEYLR